MTLYPRRSWITVLPQESDLELELNSDVLLRPPVAINTMNYYLHGAPTTSRPIFKYTQQHEFDGCGFDLSAALAATALVTAMVIKTENWNIHMKTAQSATNCNTTITITRQCMVRSAGDIDDTSVGIISNDYRMRI